MTNILGLTDKDFIEFAELKIKANNPQLDNMIKSLQREKKSRIHRSIYNM